MDPDSTDEMVDHLVDFFDQVAPEYDFWASGQHGRVAARLVETAAPKKGHHVLDVGTGTGLVAHMIANGGALVMFIRYRKGAEQASSASSQISR